MIPSINERMGIVDLGDSTKSSQIPSRAVHLQTTQYFTPSRMAFATARQPYLCKEYDHLLCQVPSNCLNMR